MKTKRITMPFLVVFVLFFVAAGESLVEGEWTPDSVEIVPGNPTSADVVDITMSGQWPDSCIPVESHLVVDGNNILFGVISDTSDICTQEVTPWELTESVGPLSPGTYRVYVSLDRGPWTLMTEFDVIAHPGAGTHTYVFWPRYCSVVQTGGVAGIEETYGIEGRLELTVDFDAGTASFDVVDANLLDPSQYLGGYGTDLGELFDMTELVGTVISSTEIEFDTNDPMPGGKVIHLDVTFMDIYAPGVSVYITGGFCELWPDGYCFEMGARAVKKRVFYVDDDAAGADDGSSWTDAFTSLHYALNVVLSGCDIRVAQGTYRPNDGVITIGDERELTFQLKSGVPLIGGYAGFGEPDPNARDIELYETILSGDLNGDDGQVSEPCGLLNDPNRAENSYSVVTAYDVDETACLDGFTITGGNADGNSGFSYTGYDGNDCGAGMLIHSSWPDGNCLPVIANCVFEDNVAANNGGGIYVYGGSPTIERCTFRGNHAENDGGGICNVLGGPPIVKNCLFIDNEALDVGGGMCNSLYSQAALTNCIFIGNVAGDSGSAILNGNSDATITNCTFYGNYTEYEGVVAISQGTGELRITNSILWNDTEAEGYYEIRNNGDLYVSYCDIQGGIEGGINNSSPPLSEVCDGGGNIDTDPCFVDPCDGDFHLKSEGWRWDSQGQRWDYDQATSRCIDAGNPGYSLGQELLTILPDWGENLRINMGAYGGTAEASMPPYGWALLGDLSNDGTIDYVDLVGQVEDWLTSASQQPGDLNRDGRVDIIDYAMLAQDWLEITDWAQ